MGRCDDPRTAPKGPTPTGTQKLTGAPERCCCWWRTGWPTRRSRGGCSGRRRPCATTSPASSPSSRWPTARTPSCAPGTRRSGRRSIGCVDLVRGVLRVRGCAAAAPVACFDQRLLVRGQWRRRSGTELVRGWNVRRVDLSAVEGVRWLPETPSGVGALVLAGSSGRVDSARCARRSMRWSASLLPTSSGRGCVPTGP